MRLAPAQDETRVRPSPPPTTFAWAHKHIAEYSGQPERLFAAGRSARSYLAGVIAVSGQMVTHITVRRERGINKRSTITADEAAPIYHSRADTPPILALVTNNDIPTRLEENRYFAAVMKAAGNTGVELHEIANRDHMGIAGGLAHAGDPAREAVRAFVRSVVASR
jgi:acetyl esterase/lipase